MPQRNPLPHAHSLAVDPSLPHRYLLPLLRHPCPLIAFPLSPTAQTTLLTRLSITHIDPYLDCTSPHISPCNFLSCPLSDSSLPDPVHPPHLLTNKQHSSSPSFPCRRPTLLPSLPPHLLPHHPPPSTSLPPRSSSSPPLLHSSTPPLLHSSNPPFLLD